MLDQNGQFHSFSNDELKANTRRTTLGYGFFALAYVASSLLIGFLVALFFPSLEEEKWFEWCMSVLPLYGIGFPILLKTIRDVPTAKIKKKKMSLLDFVLLFPMCVALMIAGNFLAQMALNYLANFIPNINLENPVSEAFSSTDLGIMIFLTVVIAPIMEELIFRKLLLDRVNPIGEGISILLSGMLFGALHGNLQQFFYATLLGMLLAFIYLKTGKIIYPILFHMLVNFLCGVLPTVLFGDILGMTENIALTGEQIKQLWTMITYIAAEYSLVAVGVALLFIFFREMRANLVPSVLKKSSQFKIAFLTPGTLLMLLVCFGVTYLSLFL